MAADVAGRSGGLLADSRDAGRHGSGTNRWYHSGQIYRTLFTLIMLCGCERVNGGDWARVARGRTFADCLARASRLDWIPSYPATGRNPPAGPISRAALVIITGLRVGVQLGRIDCFNYTFHENRSTWDQRAQVRQ